MRQCANEPLLSVVRQSSGRSRNPLKDQIRPLGLASSGPKAYVLESDALANVVIHKNAIRNTSLEGAGEWAYKSAARSDRATDVESDSLDLLMVLWQFGVANPTT